MLTGKKALLLDMNSTFMFGEDRFGDTEDFSIHYSSLGGVLPQDRVNEIIRAVYEYLDVRYPDEKYRHHFPSVETAIYEVIGFDLDKVEVENIINTFAFHELGHIPDDYLEMLHELSRHFILAAVIDIWSPKAMWLDLFDCLGLTSLFTALSFSSDHGMVKPSSKPFELIVDQLGMRKSEVVMIGDSIRRDLGGAQAAGIDCILVGDVCHDYALGSVATLLDLRKETFN